MMDWLSRWWNWRRVLEETAEVTVDQFRELRRKHVGGGRRLYAAYCRWYEIDQNDWHHW